MSSTVSSVFSTNTISEPPKPNLNVNLYDLFSSDSLISATTNPIFTSAVNICYQNAALTLHKHIDDLNEQSLPLISSSGHLSISNVSEDDFEATVFPKRTYTPSSITISQWRHDAYLGEKFLPLLFRLVTTQMHSIVLHWTELELQNEQERERKYNQFEEDLQKKLYELRAMKKSIKLDRLYELSENSLEVLVEQIDWKSIATKMRSEGGFKYFDEYSLRRIWQHRCQYGLKNSWTDNEDQILDQSVEQLGNGNWNEISQQEIFQVRNVFFYIIEIDE